MALSRVCSVESATWTSLTEMAFLRVEGLDAEGGGGLNFMVFVERSVLLRLVPPGLLADGGNPPATVSLVAEKDKEMTFEIGGIAEAICSMLGSR